MSPSTHVKGRAGEEAAALYLSRGGWSVRERNFRVPVGEIDLVATKGSVLAFVEVKSWGALPSSELEYAIDRPARQARLARAASVYLARHAALRALTPRFDVLFLRPGAAEVRHIENAFNGGIA